MVIKGTINFPEKEKQKLVDVFAMTIKITFFSV